MSQYDVLIIGAGPAGVSAAYDLRKKNKKVLLLDRHKFPRKKACAAGLTVKTVNALRYPVDPVIKCKSKNFKVSYRSMASKVLKSSLPVCFMSVRQDFDDFCLNKTLDTGAEFITCRKVLAVTEEKDCVITETDQGSISSKYLIGADGSNSRIRKLLSYKHHLYQGFAIEGIIYHKHAIDYDMEFDFGVVPFGYGWIFPKGDHINIGIYTSSPNVRMTKKQLISYAELKTSKPDVEHIAGDPMSFGGWSYNLNKNRILLTGDAAGFIDPITGEGLYNAIRSGQIAAESINESCHLQQAGGLYMQKITEITSDLNLCHKAASLFYGNLKLGYGILKNYPAGHVFMKGFSKGMTLKNTLKHFYKYLI